MFKRYFFYHRGHKGGTKGHKESIPNDKLYCRKKPEAHWYIMQYARFKLPRPFRAWVNLSPVPLTSVLNFSNSHVPLGRGSRKKQNPALARSSAGEQHLTSNRIGLKPGHCIPIYPRPKGTWLLKTCTSKFD